MAKQVTLEKRVASALNGKQAAREELVALMREAIEVFDAAKLTLDTEGARLNDLTNDDPDASEQLIRRAQHRMHLITSAFDQLKVRIEQIDAANFAQQWHERADEFEEDRNALAEELRELYPEFLGHIQGLYQRIDRNTAAIYQLHLQAPSGEHRRLLEAELVSRGLQGYNAENPPLREHLRLPDATRTCSIAFPPPAPLNPYFAVTQGAMAALKEKFALAYSPDWHEAARMRDEEERAGRVKAREEADRKAAEEKEEYHRRLLREDRARRGLQD